MRLINVRTLELESFDSDAQRPEYAILSHRWVDKQEITLHELTSQLNQHKSGWRKIRFCCEEAIRHDLEWAWVDTCCIDKTSSAELTEAINSMYRWYRLARVCFAYINDASKDSEESFRGSVWFQRSWTLQELLAPDNLRFYDASFTFMGTKRYYTGLLQSITNVPEEVLENPDTMFTRPVASRMSWAATRNATRVEDIAYSLFGIFQVNLPLLYGEGTRAFMRLQEEIIRQSDDQSIFVWDSPGHGYCPCFAISPADFRSAGDLEEISMDDDETLQEEVRPYNLTNVGLQIDCKIIQYTYNIWLAFLPWAHRSMYSSEGRQCCLFLSHSQDRINVWYRVKLQDRASCTFEEAVEMAYQHSFWPWELDESCKDKSIRQDYQHFMERYPMSEEFIYSRGDIHWRKIYIKLNPPINDDDFENMLHGVVLSLSQLLDHKMTTRSFALVSNFDWETPLNPHPRPNPGYMIGIPKDYNRISRRHSYHRRDTSFFQSQPLPKVFQGLFALYPLQPGPAGAMFFSSPRLGLKGLVLGFNQEFELTAVCITEEADVNISEVYNKTFPFTKLERFKYEFYSSPPTRSSKWLTDALHCAFKGDTSKTLLKGIHVAKQLPRSSRSSYVFWQSNWFLRVSKARFLDSRLYWRCEVRPPW